MTGTNDVKSAGNDPLPSPMPDVEALLAAGQPRTAVRRALARLSAAARSFAAAAGIDIPEGEEGLALAASVLGRASRACANPSLSARAAQCAGLLQAASPHVTASGAGPVGLQLVMRAVRSSLLVLASQAVAQHVKAGAAACKLAGQDVLSLDAVPVQAGRPARRWEWPMDPLFAACLWCLVGLAWSGLGLLGRNLTLAQGLVCCGWLLGAYCVWKVRSWPRVKGAIARWKAPASIAQRTAIIAAALAAALLLPLVVDVLRYGPASFAASEPSSLLAIVADVHPTPNMYYVDVAAVAAAGVAAVAVAAGILARKGDDGARAASFGRWRSIASIATMALWIAVLAWLAADRVFFPGTTFVEGAGELVRVEVGWGWLAVGLLGIIAA